MLSTSIRIMHTLCDTIALREITKWPGYFLHVKENDVDVYSTLRSSYGFHKMKPTLNACGYMKLNLYTNNTRTIVRLHRLIAETLIPNPNNLECVDHIDGIKLNNHPSNLQWITSGDNTRKANEMGLWGNPPKKFEIHYENGKIEIIENARKFARDYGYRSEKIIRVANGRQNRHKDIIKVITL